MENARYEAERVSAPGQPATVLGESLRVSTCLPLEAGRPALERYIATIFHAAYGATVMEYLPLLCSLQQDGECSAALGLRGGAGQQLFCEQYLDQPVQQHVLGQFGVPVNRDRVMELGNLVSSEPGQAVLLYLLVVAALPLAGVDYLLFAANRAVMASIRRCGFDTRVLGAADPVRLGERAAEWGRYYQGQPRVVLADLGQALEHGRRHPRIRALWADNAATIQDLARSIRGARA